MSDFADLLNEAFKGINKGHSLIDDIVDNAKKELSGLVDQNSIDELEKEAKKIRQASKNKDLSQLSQLDDARIAEITDKIINKDANRG